MAALRLKLAVAEPSVNRQKLIEHTEQGDSAFDGPERSDRCRGKEVASCGFATNF
jgi:hypothetical protein